MIAHQCNYLGDAARCLGDYTQAGRWYAESRISSAQSGFKGELAWALTGMGFVALAEGDASGAERLFHQALRFRKAEKNIRGIATCLVGLGSVSSLLGQTEQAVKAMGAFESMHCKNPRLFLPADLCEFQQGLKTVRMALGAETFTRLRGEGLQLSLEQAVELFPPAGLNGSGKPGT